MAPSASPITAISVTDVPSMASLAVSSDSGIVTSRVAPLSLSWNRTSSALYTGLIVVTVPPAVATPWKTMAYSGRFGAIRPTVAPARSPGR